MAGQFASIEWAARGREIDLEEEGREMCGPNRFEGWRGFFDLQRFLDFQCGTHTS